MLRDRAKTPTCAHGRLRPVHGAPIDIKANYFFPGLRILDWTLSLATTKSRRTVPDRPSRKFERRRMNSPKSRHALQSDVYRNKTSRIVICALFLLPAFAGLA